MKRLMIALLAAVAACGTAAAEPTQSAAINIDSRVTYQHVSGFGGFAPSPTWQYWLGNAEMDMLFGKGDDQLGLNIVRLYMANSKSAWSAGVSNAKRAKKYGAFIFASPWSPPASWKTNNSDSNGGELLETRYRDWAVFLNDYYLYMKQQGVEIDAVSVQNEPDWNATYQSCIWSGEQMAHFLRDYGDLIQCKIIAPEAIHFSRNMHEPILNDEGACANLDILGGHFYGWDGSSYPLAAQKGKEVWMTEFLINERQNNGIDINWKDDGFLFARSINDAMLANMSAWVHYSLKRGYGCLGDGNYGTVNNRITKRGYILSHYAKYVSGTTRIRHSLADAGGDLFASAYLTEQADTVVVMLMNKGAETCRTTFTLPFMTLGGMKVMTNENVNTLKSTFAFEEDTYQAVFDVLPYSVNTYIFAKSADRTDLADDEEQGETVFTDDFASAGASCVPTGWRTLADNGLRTAGNYSLGPRVMSFSPEGMMDYAFYFRAGTASRGYVNYGDETSCPLTLAPGRYRLTFCTEGWKATPKLTVQVKQKGKRKYMASADATPEAYVSAGGPTVRITDATEHSLTFTVEEEGNYVLEWEVEKATGGYNEALVGNVRLALVSADGIEDVTIDRDTCTEDAVYDLTGRRIHDVRSPGIYIVKGRKVYLRPF